MPEYSPKVAQLLTLGRPNDLNWDDYSKLGIGEEHEPELVNMIIDPDLNQEDTPEPQGWGPVHAWRALAQRKPVAAVEAALKILPDLYEKHLEEYLGEDLIRFCGRLGESAPQALPALEAYLQNKRYGDSRTIASIAIGRLGRNHPELRDRCVAVLASQLKDYEANDVQLNTILVSDLMELKAVEAADVIEKVYAEEYVDEFFVGTLESVQYHMGLRDTPPKRHIPELPLNWAWREEAPPETSPESHIPDLTGDLELSPGPIPQKTDHKKLRAKRKAERQARKKNRKKNRKK